MEKKLRYIGRFSIVFIFLFFSVDNLLSQTIDNKSETRVILEIRDTGDRDSLIRALKGENVEGFKVMQLEGEPILISEKAKVKLTESDIYKIVAKENFEGNWAIHIIVSNKEGISRIVKVGDKNRGEQIAVFLCGKFLAAPRVIGSLALNINKDGHFELPVFTHLKNEKEVEKFLDTGGLKAEYIKMSLEEKEKLLKFLEREREREREKFTKESLILKRHEDDK